jgi:hypothetical protein
VGRTSVRCALASPKAFTLWRNLIHNSVFLRQCERDASSCIREIAMGGLIYLIGLIVVVMFILSFLGLR